MSAKPFAPACERNRDPILAILSRSLPVDSDILEIGSGTGQHAVHFAARQPGWRWQCSDRPENLPGIRLWLEEAGLPNTPPPLALDVAAGPWPEHDFTAIFSANTLHIMAWKEVVALFSRLPLAAGGQLAIYGPFHYNGQATSPSNAAFDAQLRRDAPHRGIRDFKDVAAQASTAGLRLVADHAMPANNRLLIWKKES